ncbi:MAG TPA: transketolase [Spirochaetales bacterium]|nr:transketolase [Spirochaetales bacterium]HRY53083.1 transketolase [Spirochaetia bacterium]HRZ64920.1 transketolase [Spirochaetia bacterium]
MRADDRSRLEEAAREIRALTLDAIGFLGVGHVGGALSVVELLAVLYHQVMRVDPADPRWEGRDRLVLSKGHAGPALYAALATRGFFPREWLHTLNKGGTRLPSHCDRNRTPGVDMTTGSLGQGLSAAVGIALANRLDGRSNMVYAVLGDGESDEGQVWEAAMAASQFRLSRLVAFTDCNKLQIDGPTAEVMDLGDLGAKWAAFGWYAQRVDGHDVAAIAEAVGRAAAEGASSGRPSMIVLDTVKGKGASFCEGQASSHNMNLDYETAKKAIAELGFGGRI